VLREELPSYCAAFVSVILNGILETKKVMRKRRRRRRRRKEKRR